MTVRKSHLTPVIIKQVVADLKRKYGVNRTISFSPEELEMAENFKVAEELRKAKESRKKNGE